MTVMIYFYYFIFYSTNHIIPHSLWKKNYIKICGYNVIQIKIIAVQPIFFVGWLTFRGPFLIDFSFFFFFKEPLMSDYSCLLYYNPRYLWIILVYYMIGELTRLLLWHVLSSLLNFKTFFGLAHEFINNMSNKSLIKKKKKKKASSKCQFF